MMSSSEATPTDPALASVTGDPAVDALITQAAQLQALPVGHHKAVYTQIVAALEQQLDADPGAGLKSGAP